MGTASRQMIELGHRMIANTLANTTDQYGELYEADGSVFTDPERFRKEREILFRNTPQVICWSGDVADPGDVIAREVAGVPVLVARGEDGELRAFLNACTHRGMVLCAGAANTRRLSCPYHGWNFDLKGNLVGIANRERFEGLDVDVKGLSPLPVSEQLGLVLVGLRQDVVVDGFLRDLHGHVEWLGWQNYRSGSERHFTKRANWKLMVDLNNEAYHVPSLHRESLLPFLADHCATDTFGPHSRMCVPFKGIEALAQVPESEWPERLDTIMVTCIFPSTVIVDHMDGGSMHRISPGLLPGETTLHLIEGRPGEMDEDSRQRCEAVMEMNVTILNGEDYPATEACQRGYEAGASSLVAGRGEPLVGHWHRTWDAAIHQR